MKQFLKILLYFCLPILIIGGSLELLLRQIPNPYQVKSEYLQTHKNSIKTLLTGSSHVLYGINPEYLSDEALNYGNVSQTIDIDLEIIEQNLKDLKQLETVVLRLSYTTLFEQLKLGEERWRLKDYEIYTNINTGHHLKYKLEILSVKLKHNIARVYNYYILKQPLDYVSNSGWSTVDEVKKDINLQTWGQHIAEKHTVANYDLYSENYQILEGIVSYCQQNDIQLVLVTMPAHSSYVRYLDSDQLQKTIKAGEQMQKQYKNCSYYNFLEDKSFNHLDFIDADHLNRQGAEKFSKRLNNILK